MFIKERKNELINLFKRKAFFNLIENTLPRIHPTIFFQPKIQGHTLTLLFNPK